MEVLAFDYTNNSNGLENSMECSCDAPTNFLLPCKHTFALAIQEHGTFPLSSINNRWILPSPSSRMPEQVVDHGSMPPVLPRNEFESNRLQLFGLVDIILSDSLNPSDAFIRLHSILLDQIVRISTRPAHDASFPSDASIRGRPSSTDRFRSHDEINFD